MRSQILLGIQMKMSLFESVGNWISIITFMCMKWSRKFNAKKISKKHICLELFFFSDWKIPMGNSIVLNVNVRRLDFWPKKFTANKYKCVEANGNMYTKLFSQPEYRSIFVSSMRLICENYFFLRIITINEEVYKYYVQLCSKVSKSLAWELCVQFYWHFSGIN